MEERQEARDPAPQASQSRPGVDRALTTCRPLVSLLYSHQPGFTLTSSLGRGYILIPILQRRQGAEVVPPESVPVHCWEGTGKRFVAHLALWLQPSPLERGGCAPGHPNCGPWAPPREEERRSGSCGLWWPQICSSCLGNLSQGMSGATVSKKLHRAGDSVCFSL